MRQSPAGRGKWLFALGLTLGALLLSAWPQALPELRYDRAALTAGQWWRIVTGHLVHLNVAHLLLNLAGLLLLCELLWRDLPLVHGCGMSLFSAMVISAFLWRFHPELIWYAGLSGTLHALWSGCALSNLWQVKRNDNAAAVISFAALILLALKLAYEASSKMPVPQEQLIGAPVIYEAHLYGALTGLAYVLIWRFMICNRLRP